MLPLIIHAGYEGRDIVEKLHNPHESQKGLYCLIIYLTVNFLVKDLLYF